ncbi:MAG: 1-acyl-sn-glycerol-3-phosphate acyltransferase [Bacteroidales bacterium]|nr:1-acyl-sn-glycerol-3-phosphate acyltransferase [Bacteroidales bacterium]
MLNIKRRTLQERLARRQFHRPNWFIHFLYRTIMSGFVAPKYNPHYKVIDDINKCKGPCFIIFNHLSRLDHAFIMEVTYPKRFNILCNYGEFFRSHLHLVFWLQQVLPKKVFTDDMNSIRAINQIIKKGGCVALSPEGTSSLYGQNQPIVPGTGRFLQFYNIPVYYVHIAGSYLTSTKVCLDERKGRVETEISLLFTPEQLQKMTPEEIDDKINEAFRHDDYAWNKEKHIKWEKLNDRMCERLDDICYKCPKCGAEINMTAEKDYIKCNNCGNGARVNEYYEFVPFDNDCVIPEFPTKWVEYERMEVIREIRENPDYCFTENVKIGCLPKYRYLKHLATSVPCGEGVLTVDHQGMHFKGTRDGKPWSFDMDYTELYTLSINNAFDHFTLYIDREFTDIFTERHSLGKILLLVEEMHRLHVNTWKNFKWYDYMYKDYVNTEIDDKTRN